MNLMPYIMKFSSSNHILNIYVQLSITSDVLHLVLCPGSILPVHPDAVKDDGEFHVEDEVDDTSKRGNYHLSSLVM